MKRIVSCSTELEPASTFRSIAQDFPIAPPATACTLMMRLWFLSQADIPIIIIITYRSRLPLLKPE